MRKVVGLGLAMLLSISVLTGCSSNTPKANKEKEEEKEADTVGIWKEAEIQIDGETFKLPLENSKKLIKLGYTCPDYGTRLPDRMYTDTSITNNKGLIISAKIKNFDMEETKLMEDCDVTEFTIEKENVGTSEIIFPGGLTWDATADEVVKVLGEAKYVADDKTLIIYEEGGVIRLEFNFYEGAMTRFRMFK